MDRFIDRYVRERRLATRHALRTALRFQIFKSSVPEQRTETDNLSETGVFFATGSPMMVGAVIDLHLNMPEEITGRKAAEWRCTGHVVRVVPPAFPESNTGVGVAFDFYEIGTP